MRNLERLKFLICGIFFLALKLLLCYATTAGSHQEHRETTTSHAYTNQLSNNVRRRAIADDVTTGIPASPATEHDNSSNNTMPLNYIAWCPSNIECHKLGGDCINCDFDELCAYGKNVTVQCQPKPNINCTGDQHFTRWLHCQYCYQTPHWEQSCTNSTECKVVSAYRDRYVANCTIRPDMLCLGRRRFHRMRTCNWTSGKRWSTAIILSVTLGGFGADRFYLGLWKEGIGKLFSFGGLGVWTLVDVILIATGYVGPADNSLYIF